MFPVRPDLVCGSRDKAQSARLGGWVTTLTWAHVNAESAGPLSFPGNFGRTSVPNPPPPSTNLKDGRTECGGEIY